MSDVYATEYRNDYGHVTGLRLNKTPDIARFSLRLLIDADPRYLELIGNRLVFHTLDGDVSYGISPDVEGVLLDA